MKTLSAAHTALYRASGGRSGGSIQGMPVLLLTTTGRKSGKRRVTPLLYVRDGCDIVVVASNGGSDSSPAWWLNLRSDPAAEIEIGRTRTRAVARKATLDQRDRLWQEFTTGYAGYARYATRTAREIPVVVLTPAERS
ncbi:MAG: nitroreductase family deazaflavin-dependent oxidoreductase [Gaiellaceae bacterium]